uniref:Protein kinase domain-containing protein n=1 Tax=Rhizophagus irregularis (strain DAOM 181602 / DAOM 197198 / MUCL 43194) TaxID=747089 RepID=U9TEN0_RHIID
MAFMVHLTTYIGNFYGITKDPESNNFMMLDILYKIAIGLADIHKCRLIHHDFYYKIYGVLPYVAPEVLRGKEYTQKSDIYGFGIIAYEICTGFPPYYDIAHD